MKNLVDAQETLKKLKKQVDPEIEKYFARIIKESEKTDKNITSVLKHVKKIVLSGGKRARAAFMYYGYLAAGGKELQKIIKASVSIELIHMFLLIHDDIIDRDDTRHGVITVHKHYEKLSRRFLRNKDPKHFGSSIGIIAGDMLAALGNQVLFESDFDPKRVIKALLKLQKIVSRTIIGETQDVYNENKGKASEKEIMSMYENKTAKYTIEGPLHLGAILAGGNEKILEVLSEYSIPVGVAFQIQDDILGIFGNEAKMGKSVGADVRQGKQTILVAKAYEKADGAQRKTMDSLLGKKDLTADELEKFKKVIVETGSLDFAKKSASELVQKGREALFKNNPRVKIKKEAREFLLGIGDYIISRVL